VAALSNRRCYSAKSARLHCLLPATEPKRPDRLHRAVRAKLRDARSPALQPSDLIMCAVRFAPEQPRRIAGRIVSPIAECGKCCPRLVQARLRAPPQASPAARVESWRTTLRLADFRSQVAADSVR